MGVAVDVDDLPGGGRCLFASGGRTSGCPNLAFGGVSGDANCGFGFGSVERVRDCGSAKTPARTCPATRYLNRLVGFGFPGMNVVVLDDGGADAARLFCGTAGLVCSAL